MAEITWIKLRTDMFDNTKIRLIEKLPEGDTILVIWVKLLAAAGKANCNGYIMLSENIPMNVEEMAVIFDRPLNTVRLALEAFKRYGMVEIDENEIVRIHNWEKHQNVDGMEKIRLQTAARVAKHREKKKAEKALPLPKKEDNATCNVTVTRGNETETDLDLDIDIDIDKETDIDKDRENRVGQSSSPVTDIQFLKVKDFFSQHIREPKHADLTKLNEALEYYEPPLILEAIKEAKGKGRTFAYVLGILDNWRKEDGVKTYADWQVKIDAETKRSNGGNYGQAQSQKPTVFGDYCSD